MIINLRGTSGSGKTTAVAAVLKQYVYLNVKDGVEVYRPGKRLYLVGPYKTSCSGCDRMSSQDLICKTVRHFAKKGDVLFEGYRVSGSMKRYVALAEELKQTFVFAFMDTPLKVCLDRLNRRRKKNNIQKPLQSDHVITTWKRLQMMPAALKSAKMNVRIISHKNPTEDLLEILKEPTRYPRLK